MEIITEGFPNSGNEEILLDEISIKYYQEPDCTESRDDDGQEIIISSRDGGGGKYRPPRESRERRTARKRQGGRRESAQEHTGLYRLAAC